MIVRRELAPGTRITEGQVAELLGVSRTPVREAFQRLSFDEFLIDQPGRCAVVSPITLQKIDEAYPLIAVLEGLAVRLACPRLTEADLRHMEQLTSQMAQHGRRGDTELLMQADNSFHGVLHQRAENGRLHRVVADLRQRLERLEYVFFSTPEAVQASVRRHRKLVRILRRGRPAAAQAALEKQWELGQHAVKKLVSEMNLVAALPGSEPADRSQRHLLRARAGSRRRITLSSSSEMESLSRLLSASGLR